ncbi:MAG: UvrD-helicase domain-containing protein, partial [Nannocystaceae bacterium]
MHAIKLAISADFLQGFSRLGKQAQKKVRSFIDKFRADPTNKSLKYKSLEGMRDAKVRSARVSDKYRAIIIHPPKGDVYLLAWVDNHDEAMDWARRKVFEVNRYTGTFQVYEPTSSVPNPEVSQVGAVVTGEKVRQGFLLAGTSDEDLLFLGVPEPLLPAVRSLRTERDLDNLVAYLPAEAADALAMLAAGYSVESTFDELVRQEEDTTPVAVAQAVAEAREREPVDPNDFVAALSRQQSMREFKLLEDDAELAAMLAAPLDRWRVFLHPSQAKLITMKSNGEARVLGGAGTGKTVVAMHRARYLAKKVFTKPEHRILITTFTKNLAADIRHNMDRLCGPERERIEVKHISKVASDTLRGMGFKLQRRATPAQQDKAWERVQGLADCAFKPVFYHAEWDKVVQAQDVTDLAGYYKARRAGRGRRLTRRQRTEVWKVLACYREQLDLAGVWEH